MVRLSLFFYDFLWYGMEQGETTFIIYLGQLNRLGPKGLSSMSTVSATQDKVLVASAGPTIVNQTCRRGRCSYVVRPKNRSTYHDSI